MLFWRKKIAPNWMIPDKVINKTGRMKANSTAVASLGWGLPATSYPGRAGPMPNGFLSICR
jgi:hypothetical protein